MAEKLSMPIAAEIRNGEAPALKFFRLHPLVARAVGEIFRRLADFAQRFVLRRANDRRHQSIFDRDGDCQDRHRAYCTIASPSNEAFTFGTFTAAMTAAFKTKSLTVIFDVSAPSPADFNSARAAMSGPGVDLDVEIKMRDRRLCFATRRSAMTLRMPERLMRDPSPASARPILFGDGRLRMRLALAA